MLYCFTVDEVVLSGRSGASDKISHHCSPRVHASVSPVMSTVMAVSVSSVPDSIGDDLGVATGMVSLPKTSVATPVVLASVAPMDWSLCKVHSTVSDST